MRGQGGKDLAGTFLSLWLSTPHAVFPRLWWTRTSSNTHTHNAHAHDTHTHTHTHRNAVTTPNTHLGQLVREVALEQVGVVDDHRTRRALHHRDDVGDRRIGGDVDVDLDVAGFVYWVGLVVCCVLSGGAWDWC